MIRASLASLLVLAACNSGTGLGNRAGPYIMTAVDQAVLPHVVSTTSLCDELIVRGILDLQAGGSFILQVGQVQDCGRSGGSADSFTTTVSGTFTVTGNRLSLRPAGTGADYAGTASPGAVEVQLPPLPLVSSAPPATFVKFPL